MLNAAIVGLGRWGQRLVDSVQSGGKPRGEHIRFVRAATRSPEKGASYANAQRLELGASYDEVLADPAVNAVVLASPHSQHAAQIEAAARAGKHVFVEKPVTLDLASAERAAGACRRAGVLLAAGFNRRFLDSVRELRRMIADGTLGQMIHVEGNFSGNAAMTYPPGMWRTSREESPAGGMTGMGIHTVDSFVGLFGPIVEARCLSIRQAIPVDIDDTTSMLLRFKSGMTGYLGTFTATPRTWRIQAFGTKGWAHLRDQWTMDIAGPDGTVRTRTWPETDIERLELEAFARAVAGTEPYPVPVEEVLQGVAAFEAIVASAAKGGAPVAVRGAA